VCFEGGENVAAKNAGRNFLFVPGPTNVPDRVMRAMMVAMEDHRSSKFPELTLWLFQETKKVFKTEKGQVFIFPSSGTGAWEAALSNTLLRGDKFWCHASASSAISGSTLPSALALMC
jgi:alanine-glyoxylate transaminase/serine-glyoxylate transaminase/serine-pyruvate transaminase